jgi:3-hydroxy acid dehydrogenase/malonic semialdehyde reductase
VSRLQGKLAFITGASAGIGLAVAKRFAAEGANLALWARREERLERIASELEGRFGVSVNCDGVDVRDRDAVNAAAARMLAVVGTPDILLNNAGLAAGFSKTQDGDPDDWDRMIDTNVKGLLYVTRAILPKMVERGTGHVVNLGSLAGLQVYPMGNVYNASKFAVKALTEAINLDVLGTRIRVSGIEPGHVRTEFADVRFEGDQSRVDKVYEGFTPLSPDDVADVISYVVNAPENVNILDVVMVSTAQRSVHHVHRGSPS